MVDAGIGVGDVYHHNDKYNDITTSDKATAERH